MQLVRLKVCFLAGWQVLKLLAGPFLRQHAGYQQRVVVILLEHVLLLPGQRKLALAALKALKKQDIPALSGGCPF